MTTTATKKIAAIEVIAPGSDPDVDSDFNTQIREKAVEYVNKEYGHVANIITFNTLKAKKAFKAMCTIYEVPFAEANKVSALIPGGAEGKEPTMADLYDKESDFYNDAVDFRNATSGAEWKNIIDGAKSIEGRNDSVGVHACGIVISAKPLEDVIPTHVRQTDGVRISQWTYPELESMGLIKMDFLGLDTVDLIQHAVENIQKMGKKAPSMLELIHGPMDDEKTYRLLGRGDTIGIFQLAGDGMRELLRTMKPTHFMDIAACNALFRPGPMGMGSHTKYALRKNDLESVDYPVHEEFKGSELEEILKDTYFLVVYQEQIIQIANRIAGMTLQQGDDLRKAMGKKKKSVMDSMRPVFFEGARANGFSDEAITELWDTIETFAQYGFNLSHSVAYAMNGYQSAYLKANYPKEFMAALIAQRVGDKEKTRVHLQEARRMGLKVGPVSANISDVRVSPTNEGPYDIVYGFSGVSSVSEDSASIIVEERKANGDFKDPEDFVKRCYAAGLTSRSVYENLAYAGAFDAMGVTRKSMIEVIPQLLTRAKTTRTKGLSLFDLMGGEERDSTAIQYSEEDFDYGDKLRREADTIGIYVSGHPMDYITTGDLQKMEAVTLETMLSYRGRAKQFRVVCVPTDVRVKATRRGGKSLLLELEDKTATVSGRLERELFKAIEKGNAQEKFKELYCKGSTELEEFYKIATDKKVQPERENILKNRLYVFEILFRPSWDDHSPHSITVLDFQELKLTVEGKLPVRVRFRDVRTEDGRIRRISGEKAAKALKEMELKLRKRARGESSAGYTVDIPVLIARYREDGVYREVENVAAYKQALELSQLTTSESPKKKKQAKKKLKNDMFSGAAVEVAGKKTKAGKEVKSKDARSWPPEGFDEKIRLEVKERDVEAYAKALNNLDYKTTKRRASKLLNTARQVLGEYGIETMDVDNGFAIIEED